MTRHFLTYQKSISELMKTFKLFLKPYMSKPNISKSEVADIGSLKRVKMAVYYIKCVGLTTETIYILSEHFPYNQRLQIQKNSVKTMKNEKYYSGGENNNL